MSDALTRLAELPVATPDAVRGARTRQRCRARLARQAPRPEPEPPGHIGRAWQPVILLLAIGYMAEVAVEALRVYGLR